MSTGRCDGATLSRPLSVERSDELLDLGPAHGALPPLRVQIDDVQAQAVLADSATDPFIAPLPMAWPASAREPPYPIFRSSSTTRRSKKAGEAALTRPRTLAARLASIRPCAASAAGA